MKNLKMIIALACGLAGCELSGEVSDSPDPRALPYTLSGPAGVTQEACSTEPYVLTRQGTTTLQLGVSLAGGQVYKDAGCTTLLGTLSLTTTSRFWVKSVQPGAHTLSITGSTDLTRQVAVYRAINVRTTDLVPRAKGDDRSNDSAALEAAIHYASRSLPRDYPDGPLAAQAIVYVPRGTYRIRNVTLESNVRLEIDAGAVFKHCTRDGDCLARGADASSEHLFKVDAPVPTSATDTGHPPARNVSIVGVGTSMEGKKSIPGWDVSHSFTINVDPDATGCSPQVGGILLRYSQGVELANLYSVGNNTTREYKNPLVKFKASEDSLRTAAGMYAPHDVTYTNHVHLRSTKGGGNTQLQAGQDVFISRLYNEGGAATGAVRLETDSVGDVTLHNHGCESLSHIDQQGPNCTCTVEKPCKLDYYSELDDIVIDDVTSKGGLAAVWLVPHNQQNVHIFISGARGVDGAMAVYKGHPGRDTRLPAGGFSDVNIAP